MARRVAPVDFTRRTIRFARIRQSKSESSTQATAEPRFILKSAVERGSFDQTMDEMDVVDPVDFTRKGIDFLVHFVHKVHDVQRIAHRIRS